MQGQDVRIDEDSSGSTASLEYVETASTTSQESGGDTLSQDSARSIESATNSQESKPFADKSEDSFYPKGFVNFHMLPACRAYVHLRIKLYACV